MAISNSQLATRVETLIQSWTRRERQYANWLGGTADGGPNGDGRYELTDGLGATRLVSCPAALAHGVSGPAALAEAAMAAAEIARDASVSEATRSAAQAVLAEAARVAAVTARDRAERAQEEAQNAEANAKVHRDYAELAREGTAADLLGTTALHSDTQYQAAWAENWAIEAKAAADRAGNYDPLQYATKADGLTQIVGLQDALGARAVLAVTNQFAAGQRIQTGSNISGTDYGFTPAELALASFVPRLAFEDRTTNARNMLMAWQGSGVGGDLMWRVDYDADGTYSHEMMRLTKEGPGSPRLTVGGSPVLTAATLAASDAVTTSQTNLGRTGAGPLVKLENAALASAPTGYSAMTLPESTATPLGTYGYIFKHGRRDVADGWAGTWITHPSNVGDKPRAFVGGSVSANEAPAWAELWTDSNLAIPIGWLGVIPATGSDLNTYMVPGYAHQNTNAGAAAGANYPTTNAGLLEVRKSGTSDFVYQTYTSYAAAGGTGRRTIYHRERYGGVWSAWRQLWDSESFDPSWKLDSSTDRWLASMEGKERFYFGANGRTFIRGHNGIELRNSRDAIIGRFEENGEFISPGKIHAEGGLEIRNVSPTVFLRDTNHRGAMIHVNENKFYVLRGAGIDNPNWSTTGSGWPMVIYLDTNDVEFNGEVWARGDKWLRVEGNTGLYFQSWGGGWHMTDGTWIRAFNNKGIATGGEIMAGSFSWTDGAKLPRITSGTAAPSGGSDGDLYVQF